MNVGESVRKTIDDWQQAEVEAAMLHACNAVDGTARKVFPGLHSNARFTRLLRENYGIFGPFGAPGIDVAQTRFPVKVVRPKAEGGEPDIADVIYGVHRCTQGHGDELPGGFELLPDAGGPAGRTRMMIERGKVRLSDRVIFGLLAVAVTSPANTDQVVPEGYHLTYGSDLVLPINEWWGRASDLLDEIARRNQLPNVKLDFREWMEESGSAAGSDHTD